MLTEVVVCNGGAGARFSRRQSGMWTRLSLLVFFLLSLQGREGYRLHYDPGPDVFSNGQEPFKSTAKHPPERDGKEPVSKPPPKMAGQEPLSKPKRNCKPIPQDLLLQTLGGVFNDDYMAIAYPENSNVTVIPHSTNVKEKRHVTRSAIHDGPNTALNRSSEILPLVYVDDEFLTEEPAWQVSNFEKIPGGKRRFKRYAYTDDSHSLDTIPYHCEARPVYRELGPDFFPRYVITKDCNNHICPNKDLKCTPETFGIHILRLRNGSCASLVGLPVNPIGYPQFSEKLWQHWDWVNIKIVVCCVCRMPNNF